MKYCLCKYLTIKGLQTKFRGTVNSENSRGVTKGKKKVESFTLIE